MTDVPTLDAIERACYPWRHTFPSMAKRDGWTAEMLAEARAKEISCTSTSGQA